MKKKVVFTIFLPADADMNLPKQKQLNLQSRKSAISITLHLNSNQSIYNDILRTKIYRKLNYLQLPRKLSKNCAKMNLNMLQFDHQEEEQRSMLNSTINYEYSTEYRWKLHHFTSSRFSNVGKAKLFELVQRWSFSSLWVGDIWYAFLLRNACAR